MEEMKSNPEVAAEGRKKMLGILDRFEKEAIDQERMMDMSEEDILRQIQGQQQQQQQRQHGPPEKLGTAYKSDGRDSETPGAVRTKLTPKERSDLIRKAIEEEQKEANIDLAGDDGSTQSIDPEQREEMERMLEQEHQDMMKRFQDVDLDKESFDSIWARLTPEEQQEFREKFMISTRMDDDDALEESAGASVADASDAEADDHEEELEAKRLLQEMGDTLKRGGANSGKAANPMMADLDTEDLRAIRDAEISELIPIWRPWWEVEAEEAGHLKKVVVSEVANKEELDRLNAASISTAAPQAGPETSSSIPEQIAESVSPSGKVLERFVLDEEAMLQPLQALVQDVEKIRKEQERIRQGTDAVVPMVRAPHPSMIYHVCALLFAYVATCRVLNGDLIEEPEQTLAYIFDLCPFFSPPGPAPASIPSTSSTANVRQIAEVDDFETTLAVLQASSLNSKLWKGDTLRLEMLSLLLRDLTLILARPSRCLCCIRQLKDVFSTCMTASGKGPSKRQRLYEKSTLHRLFKKLEFYESYLLSEEWMLRSDRLDRVRTEVVVTGIRVRQEMVGWTQDIEKASRAQGPGSDTVESKAKKGADTPQRVLIEELS
ncbi:hypothetical protein BGZ54_001064 [Gamsiella multidivaricata]|nr:hypothetical protein BGZ54_001064 [Gamsiella multidivaricata]